MNVEIIKAEINTNLATFRYYAERRQASNLYRTILILARNLANLLPYSARDVERIIYNMKRIMINTNMYDIMIHYYNLNGNMPKKEVE